MTKASEHGTCDVTDSFGGKNFKCEVPTEYKCTKILDWWVCKHHLPYAMIAGFEPKKIEELNRKEELGMEGRRNEITSRT